MNIIAQKLSSLSHFLLTERICSPFILHNDVACMPAGIQGDMVKGLAFIVTLRYICICKPFSLVFLHTLETLLFSCEKIELGWWLLT